MEKIKPVGYLKTTKTGKSHILQRRLNTSFFSRKKSFRLTKSVFEQFFNVALKLNMLGR